MGMIGMKIDMAKGLFFDSKKVLAATTKAERRVLSKFGAYVRRSARSSIRKRKKSSEPGKPPSSHTGVLKQFIYFAYEPASHNVVIGPIALSGKVGRQPKILEHGGTFTLRKDRIMRVGKPGRNAKGRFTLGKRVKVPKGTQLQIKARPFMGPAFEKEKPKLPAMWRNSVRA